MKEVTKEHCAAMQWAIESWVYDCAEISVYIADINNHDRLEEKIKKEFPDLHQKWVDYNISEHGEDREKWKREMMDGKIWYKDDLPHWINNYTESNKELSYAWHNSDSFFFQFYASCYNLDEKTKKAWWDTWDEYVESMPYLKDEYDRIISENLTENREERLGKILGGKS